MNPLCIYIIICIQYTVYNYICMCEYLLVPPFRVAWTGCLHWDVAPHHRAGTGPRSDARPLAKREDCEDCEDREDGDVY